jgi:hypothetical protein
MPRLSTNEMKSRKGTKITNHLLALALGFCLSHRATLSNPRRHVTPILKPRKTNQQFAVEGM